MAGHGSDHRFQEDPLKVDKAVDRRHGRGDAVGRGGSLFPSGGSEVCLARTGERNGHRFSGLGPGRRSVIAGVIEGAVAELAVSPVTPAVHLALGQQSTERGTVAGPGNDAGCTSEPSGVHFHDPPSVLNQKFARNIVK